MRGAVAESAMELRLPGFVWLLGPKVRSRINRVRCGGMRVTKLAVISFAGLFFWALIFAVILRMLLYFRGTQGIGDLLAGKLLGLALLTFLMIVLISNVLTALSTFFLSKDLELLVASPVDPLHLYTSRLVETLVHSSWMVGLLVVPLIAGYGVTYAAGPTFYLLAALVMAPFLVLPAVLGSAVTLVLVNVFPARRTRDLLALTGLLTAGGVVAFFRFLRPERLVRPDEFRDLVDFVAVLRTPSSPWLPSQWASDTLMAQLNGRFDAFPLLLLISTAAAVFVLGAWLHQRLYPSGFTRAQEGQTRREGRVRGRFLERVFAWTDPRTRELVSKEIRVFLRDATQWSQLLLLAVLVAVYVYNIKVLPLYTGERVSFLLVNVISFLNLGLAGFVVAAIAARFVFPAMSLEGRMMWLLRSSPMEIRHLFWSKYWVGTVPLLAVSVPLIVGTNLILSSSPLILVVSTVTMVAVTMAMTALALGLGAVFPNFETENAAEVPMSFGGLLFMMVAVTYLAAVVILEAFPVYEFLFLRLQRGVNPGVDSLIRGFGGAAVLTVLVIVLPLRAGVKKVGAADF